MNHLRHVLLTACLIVVSGCATVTPLPSGFDAGRLTWAASAEPTLIALDGPSGKGHAAGKGALAGGGTGLVYSSLLCASTGPFAAICLAAVVPAMTVGGAGVGAIAAAVVAESAADLDFKRGFLATQITTSPSPQSRLITRLTRSATPHPSSSSNASTREWVGTLSLTALGAESGQRLFAQAKLSLHRAGAIEEPHTSSYQVSEKIALKSDEANPNDDVARLAAVNLAFDKLLDNLAQEVLRDLNRDK